MATGDDFLTRFRPGSAKPDAARPDVSRTPEKSSILAMLEGDAAAKTAEQPAPPDARRSQEARGGPQTHPVEGDDAEPVPSDTDAYRAHSRASSKPQIMLGLVTREIPLDAFAYSDLRRVRLLPPDEPGGGPVLVLRFIEAGISDVAIRGRNLEAIADYVKQHRLAWLRQIPAGRDIRDPRAAVITSIVIQPAGE